MFYRLIELLKKVRKESMFYLDAEGLFLQKTLDQDSVK